MNFPISLFQNVGDTRPLEVSRSWDQLCAKFRAPLVREEKDGLLFSPARYSGNRRLQSNVIDLSLLVLEIDGAWRCDCCGQAGSHVMFVSNRVRDAAGKVDRSPRCPACLKEKCEKCYRKSPKPRTETVLSQIDFSFESVIEGMRLVFPRTGFAIYSTHSHQRVTALTCGKDFVCRLECRTDPCGSISGHEHAERCYRLIVPLASPVPVADFPALWQWAVKSLHQSEVVADPQTKDPNRIFYTPVKRAPDAPYEFHVEEGGWFDWRKALSEPPAVAGGHSSGPVATATGSDFTAQPSAFATHEDRHEELCKRIMDRGKQNTRDNYDAKCQAHNGRGNTSLGYYPASGIVQCNAGCSYWEVLRAEGLPDNHLPSRDRLAADQARCRFSKTQVNGQPSFVRDKPLTVALLHAVYATMLAHQFELSPEHEALVRKHWRVDPFGTELIPWFGEDAIRDRPVKMCSMPNSVQKTIAVNQLSRWFDLTGVPGFFRELATQQPQSPNSVSAIEHWQTSNFGPWRLYLPYAKGLLVPYTNDAGFIVGIQIHKSIRDRNPTLLTSRGLPCGAKAIAPKREAGAA
jgi:hypothetical protein